MLTSRKWQFQPLSGAYIKQQSFGDRVRQARLDLAAKRGREVRMSELAEAVGLTGSAISQWESGTTTPKDLDQIVKAAAFLEVEAGWLAFGTPPCEDAPPSGKDAPERHDFGLPISRDIPYDFSREANVKGKKKNGGKKAS